MRIKQGGYGLGLFNGGLVMQRDHNAMLQSGAKSHLHQMPGLEFPFQVIGYMIVKGLVDGRIYCDFSIHTDIVAQPFVPRTVNLPQRQSFSFDLKDRNKLQ